MVEIEKLQLEIQRRQQAESELLAAEALAQVVLDTAVEGIITIDDKGIIQSFNRAAETIFGYQVREMIGSNVNCLMPQPYQDEHDSYISNYLSTKRPKIIGIGRRVKGLRKNGSSFPMDLAVSEVVTHKGHYFTGIVRDISVQFRAEEEARLHREQLAHVDRIGIMGEMTTGIAHEINQPLTAISSYARACYRLIESDHAEKEELLNTLDKINAQAQRAGDVIHRLRGFIKKRPSQRDYCKLNDLVNDTIILAETDAQEHNFKIRTVLASDQLSVVVDAVQIQQVILNLIRNAVEAMAGVATPGDEITITLTTAPVDPDMVQVMVADKGVGIDDAIANQLFDPFFTTKTTGTGIGLAISRTIITSHGGTLWFEHNQNQGITMHFTLPLAATVPHE